MKQALYNVHVPAEEVGAEHIKELTLFHMRYSRGKDWRTATSYDIMQSFCMAIHDLALDRMIVTQNQYATQEAKRLYYLSMEFLIGKLMMSNLHALGVLQAAKQALEMLDVDLATLLETDVEAGLGNGGLGRLAACFLDSLASLEMPGYGYGLRYEYGIFRQSFINGWQQENPDHWLTLPYPWEMARPEYNLPVLVYGRLEKLRGPGNKEASVWVDWQMFEGIPFDIPIIGHGVNTVNMLRLWDSHTTRGFQLDVFNRGDYVSAVEEQNWAENVTKVLYPSDSTFQGKELRLIQEYFLATCSIRDVMRRHERDHGDWNRFAELNAIQLNDTHPALAVSELMRCFVDDKGLPWGKAWELTTRTFSYTNHTLLPEALEKWPVDMFARVLPRHLQIIYDINTRFLQQVEVRYHGDTERIRRMSLIEEGPVQQVRMANLAVVGSHAVNGVSALHSELVRKNLLRDFAEMWPSKFQNVTNGISHRRWLLQCNPGLANLITDAIGDGWIGDLEQLRRLEPMASDPVFQTAFLGVKRKNKEMLVDIVRDRTGYDISPESLFDVQVKRLHMYKRQLLNALHIIYLYYKLKQEPETDITPRTFIFGAKAAPSYHIAKLVIKLINELGEVINNDPDIGDKLKVIFLPDYNVSLAERVIPAADVSEQISTAGTEASGTGNMKLALNGALTVGTWDGATIEIAQHVGEENIFIFGHREDEITAIRNDGYNPQEYYENDTGLRQVLDSLKGHVFSANEPGLFEELFDQLTVHGDYFCYLPDFRAYVECQERVGELYRDQRTWAEKAILNIARMGWFSSDRSIREYAQNIWGIASQPVNVEANPS